ncbi:MAG: four helix bundle protein [Alistipes sp.]|nr:four helix bundle protein [Alistipes sp.]
MKSNNIVLDKSFDFAVRVVKLYKYLRYTIDERVMSTQVLKSGTSIGANIREALRSSSRKDFVAKMNISLKEAYETEYWLELLYRTEYISEKEYNSIFPECRELTNILSQIILTTKAKDSELSSK